MWINENGIKAREAKAFIPTRNDIEIYEIDNIPLPDAVRKSCKLDCELLSPAEQK